MKSLIALNNKIIGRLWAALTLSCVGAEIYTFAIVWIATARFGSDSSYLIALQAAIVLISTLTSGAFTDGFSNKSMMLLSDISRFIITLVPFICWQITGNVSTSLLVGVIVIVSYFRPVFDPALQAILPAISSKPSELQTINGLFDVVRRIARIAGPALAAFMFTVISVYDFFLINALTYLVSAIFILTVSKELSALEHGRTPANRTGGFVKNNLQAISGGFKALNKQFAVNYHLIAYAFCNGGWYISLVVGLALKMHINFPDKSEYFGYVLGVYGIFNVISNLIFSELSIHRPVLAMSAGRILSGIALLMMAFSNSLPLIMLFAALAAVGAPITQLPLATLMQTRFARDEIVKVFRCRMFYEWLFLLLALLIAPTLITLVGLQTVMLLSASCYLLLGFIGIYATHDEPSEYLQVEKK
ncbi:TPA: MFS transporter [Enterobacter cloacae]